MGTQHANCSSGADLDVDKVSLALLRAFNGAKESLRQTDDSVDLTNVSTSAEWSEATTPYTMGGAKSYFSSGKPCICSGVEQDVDCFVYGHGLW